MRKLIPSLAAMVSLLGLIAIAAAQQERQPAKMPPRNPNAGFLGAKLSPVTDELADQLKLDTQDGVVVVEVVGDSPAQTAGLKEGDVIRQMDDKKIDTVETFVGFMRATKPDQQVKVGLMREGKMQDLTVTLGKIPADMLKPPAERENSGPTTGPTTKPGD
jgi:serine protease Do